MNVLVSAYACEPGRGSEGEIGWSIVHELATRHEVWVITRANNKTVHDAAFAVEPKPDNLNFIYYDTPKWARWYKKGKRFFLIYYYLWQLGSFFEARRFLKTHEIYLVHHLTGGMDWMPSGLALLGLPFLWGPVGSETTHPVILKTLPFSVRLKELFRKGVLFYGRQLDPFVRLTGRRAKIILSHTPENLPRRYADKVIPYVQTGINPTVRFAKQKSFLGRGDKFTVIYAGELIHWKGASYALDAFISFARGCKESCLIMIGDGSLRHQLEKKVEQSGVAKQVEFLGKVSMERLIEELPRGDVFLYPCYHHGLATIVLQAMLTGLPVICLEGDAIGRTVGSECGITVPLNKSTDFIPMIADALSRLNEDEALRVILAKRAREKTMDTYSYQVVSAGYDEIYRRVLE